MYVGTCCGKRRDNKALNGSDNSVNRTCGGAHASCAGKDSEPIVRCVGILSSARESGMGCAGACLLTVWRDQLGCFVLGVWGTFDCATNCVRGWHLTAEC